MKRQIALPNLWLCVPLLVGSLTLPTNKLAITDDKPHMIRVEERLALRVENFDNHDEPLISTLFRIAAHYHLPMGIERVTMEALQKPIKLTLAHGTIATLLDLSTHGARGYEWAVRDGVIHIYGVNEWKDPSNLFNIVIPSFELLDETIGQADRKLTMSLAMQYYKASNLYFSLPGSSELEKKFIRFKLENSTVRQILNRLVAMQGDAIWIASVPPESLTEMPQRGLWVLLPLGIFSQEQFRSVEFLNALLHISAEPKPSPKK